jgi:hypothetical protein
MQLIRPQIDPFKLKPNILAKWPVELLGEGFVPFPKKLLRTLGVLFENSREIDELVVLLAAVDYKRDNFDNRPSVEYLAFTAGIPARRFREALSRLKKKAWVEIDVEPADDTIDITIVGLSRKIISLLREDDPIETIGRSSIRTAVKKIAG